MHPRTCHLVMAAETMAVFAALVLITPTKGRVATTTVEAETMTLSGSSVVVHFCSAASGGKDHAFYSNGSASRGFEGAATQMVLCARHGLQRASAVEGLRGWCTQGGDRPHQCHPRGPRAFFASSAEIARLHSLSRRRSPTTFPTSSTRRSPGSTTSTP